MSSGPSRVVVEAPNLGIDPYHHAYDISPDDRRFLMINRAVNDVSELVLVVNWFEEG